MHPTYLFITGGVFSGLGKGIAAASIGKILQARGFKVTVIKIDPYLNYDAGTLRPTEHGEVWVTEDGGEIDQDLGHYERFLDINIPKENNITTGKIYGAVIEKERKGHYLGKTVEVIPHVTDEIKDKVRSIAKKSKANFVIVEIGGTVGEYQNEIYYRAARLMKTEGNKVLFIHIGYLPVPKHLGEMKTKPLQQSVEKLYSLGIQPDFIICRSEYPVDDVRKEKLAVFCNVTKNEIISNPDLEYSYELPLVFEKEKLAEKILERLNLPNKKYDLKDWKKFIDNLKNGKRIVKVGIVGKYFDIGEFKLVDSYISVIESIKHAAAKYEVKPELYWIDSKDFEGNERKLEMLKNFDGIIVPGGFGASGVEGKILAIKYVRENNIPFLGLCFGLQLAVVEFARNVCGLEGANSTEIDPKTKYPVIDFLPWQKELIRQKRYGATMRLGGQVILIKKGTLAYRLYKKTKVIERFRHRYEINPRYIKLLEKNGFVFSGKSSKELNVMQIGELPKHRFFIGTQAHPEMTSRPLSPNPLFDGFMRACVK